MTTKGRYALRAAIALAQSGAGKSPVSIRSLSEAEGLSPEFLEQIFYRLRKAGLIASARGPGGGFYFSRPLDEISLKEIVSGAGEDLGLADCAGDERAACPRQADCLAGGVWRELTGIIDGYLAGTTLGDVIARAPKPVRE